MSISIVWSNTGDDVPHLKPQKDSNKLPICQRFIVTIGFNNEGHIVGQDEIVVLRVVP